MKDPNQKQKIISGVLWRLLESGGTQIMSFVVSIILARLLDPEVYGTLALVTVFIAILQVFLDSGLGNALIQKIDADDVDFSSVFYFNVFMCIVLYGALFFAAPLIAAFYELPELIPIVRVLGLSLVISGVRNIQQAYVYRQMIFKKFFFSTLASTITAAVVGIAMAFMGFGVWALVAQNLLGSLMGTVVLWITVPWRPKMLFSWKRLKGLLSFSWKLLASALLDTGYNNLSQLIIGKRYSNADLAYYNKGNQIPQLVVSNISVAIDSVLFPSLSQVQDDQAMIKAMSRRAIRTSTYIVMPMMAGIAACAQPLIQVLLTDKWLDSVLFMRVFCFVNMFFPVAVANLNAIKAMGRSDIFLKLEIVKKAVGLTAILVSMWISVDAMAYSLIFTTVISLFINGYPNRKLVGYSYREQFQDMMPTFILSAVMAVLVYLISFADLSPLVTLFVQVPAGVLIYVAGSWIFKLDGFVFLLDVLKGFLKK